MSSITLDRPVLPAPKWENVPHDTRRPKRTQREKDQATKGVSLNDRSPCPVVTTNPSTNPADSHRNFLQPPPLTLSHRADVLQARPALLRRLRQRLHNQVPHQPRGGLRDALRRQVPEELAAPERALPGTECGHDARGWKINDFLFWVVLCYIFGLGPVLMCTL